MPTRNVNTNRCHHMCIAQRSQAKCKVIDYTRCTVVDLVVHSHRLGTQSMIHGHTGHCEGHRCIGMHEINGTVVHVYQHSPMELKLGRAREGTKNEMKWVTTPILKRTTRSMY